MTEFLIEMAGTALLIWFAYWRRDFILYVVSIPACAMFGFAWYERYPTNIGLVFSLTIIAIGMYSFWKGIEIIVDKIRGA